MSNTSDAIIVVAIHSAFKSYPEKGAPDSRNPSWIIPEEFAQLTKVLNR